MTSRLANLVARYERQPIIRGLVQLIPFGIGSAADTATISALARYEEERLRTFFDELVAANVELTDEVIQSEDFVHAFTATSMAARRTRRREKIRYLAKLLSSTFDEDAPQTIDEYEELLSIVEEMSLRELQILACLALCEREAQIEAAESELQRAEKIWPRFEQLVQQNAGVPGDQLAPMLVRIQRTGCYAEITGGYWNYTGGRGRLTPLYWRLELLAGSILDSTA